MCKAQLVFIAAVLVFLTACSKPKETEADAEAAAPVQVAAAKRQTIEQFVAVEAILYPARQANVTPKISAPVARFLVQRGDHVREGQLLAVLEHRDLSSAAQESEQLYRQAQAAYQTTTAATVPEDSTKAKADVDSSKEALDAAEKVYQNRQTLVREGALPQKMADDAQVSFVQAKSAYQTAEQHYTALQTVSRNEQIKSAQAQMDAAKAHYQSAAAQAEYAEIRSPINGVISDRPVNLGEVAGAGSPLFSIVDISKVVARANVPVQQAAQMHVGQETTLKGAGGELTGKITVVSPSVDTNTTTVQVWAEAINKGEKLKPGSTVQMSVNAGEVPNAVVIPAAALLASDEGGEKVMVAGSDSLAHEHKVEVGIRSGGDVQILEGVNPGDQVIVAGGLGLDDKAKIKIGEGGDENKKDDDKKEDDKK